MPFEGLSSKHLRYAEVLGHELAHALLTLTDPDHASLCQEVEREVSVLAAYLRVRLERIRIMSEELERKPEAVDVDIRRELLQE